MLKLDLDNMKFHLSFNKKFLVVTGKNDVAF